MVIGYIVVTRYKDSIRPSIQRIWTKKSDAIREQQYKTKTNVWGRKEYYEVCEIHLPGNDIAVECWENEGGALEFIG